MSREIPQHEPTSVQIGSPWNWDITYPDFPADENWELSYYLRGADDQDFLFGSVVTAGTGAEFEVRIPASTTSGITTAGSYRLIGRVSKTGHEWDGHVVYNKHVLVLADPADAVNAKSHNRQMLEALRTARLSGASSHEKVKIEVNGRSVTYRDAEELDSLIGRYELLVALEENPDGRIAQEVEFRRA